MYIEWKQNNSSVFARFSFRQVGVIILKVIVNILFGTEVWEDKK
jgi:hypothetical protein